MKDELISFETAKLAKEKGFDVHSFWYYLIRDSTFNISGKLVVGQLKINMSAVDADHIRNGNYAYAPTQSLLQRWLREVHGINIDIHFGSRSSSINYFGYYHAEIHGPKGGGLQARINYKEGDFYPEKSLSYEECLEKCLFEALKLIK